MAGYFESSNIHDSEESCFIDLDNVLDGLAWIAVMTLQSPELIFLQSLELISTTACS